MIGALELDRGLLLTVRGHGEGQHPGTLEEMLRFFAEKNPVQGRGFRPMVFDGFNPFGPSERYASHYRGLLEVPKPGKHAFSTVSDDASFLLVDGNLAAAWPGEHTIQGGERGEKSGEVELSSGVHRLDYYHEEIAGEQLAVAAWKRPGEERFEPIPPSAFRPLFEAPVTAAARRGSPVAADFVLQPGDELEVPGVSMVHVSARAAVHPAPEGLELRWDFGDGQTARGAAAEHVYFDHGTYAVTLRVVRPGGEGGRAEELLDQVTQRLDTEVLSSLGAQGHGTHQFLAVVRTYDPSKLQGTHLERVLKLFEHVEQTQGSLPFLSELRSRQLADKAAAPAAPATPSAPAAPAARAATALQLAVVLWGDSRDEEKALPLAREAQDAAAPIDVSVRALELELDILCHGATRQPAPALDKIAKALGAGDLADPARRRLEVALGDGLRFRGDRDGAARAYLKAGEWDREGGKRRAERDERRGEVDRSHFLLRARNLLHRRELDEARRTLEAWAWEYPLEKLAGAYSLTLAQHRMQLGSFAQALDELWDFARACPTSNLAPAAILLEGEILLREEKRGPAAEVFRRLLRDYPESPQVEEAGKHLEALTPKGKP
ncbi:MAG: PKD domain-containing protein [Planctomycetes bacterium]|nr:PKD domain-containing protein [Planctomycetota bacterium]